MAQKAEGETMACELLRGRKVLFVDDSAPLRLMCKALLTKRLQVPISQHHTHHAEFEATPHYAWVHVSSGRRRDGSRRLGGGGEM